MTHPQNLASPFLIHENKIFTPKLTTHARAFFLALNLITAPLFAMQPTPQALAQQAAWQQLERDNSALAQDILHNQDLAQALGEKPELIPHVAKHQNLVDLAKQYPGLIELAMAKPQFVPQIAANPHAIPALLAKFGKSQQAGAAGDKKKKKDKKPAGQAGAGAPDDNDGEDKHAAEQRERRRAAPAGFGGIAYNMSRDVIAGMKDAMGSPEENFARAIRAARENLGSPEENFAGALRVIRENMGTPEENLARLGQALEQFMADAQPGEAGAQVNGEGARALRAALEAIAREGGRALQNGFRDGGEMDQGMGEGMNAAARVLQRAIVDGGAFDQAGAAGIEAFNRQIGRLMEGLEAHLRDGGSLDNFFQAGAGNLDRNLGRFSDALMRQIGDGGEVRRAIDEIQQVMVQNSVELLSVGVNAWKWTIYFSILGYFSYYTAEYGLRVFWNFIDRKLQQPKLLLSSSQKTLLERLHIMSRPKQEPIIMVLSPEQEERFKEFEAALKVTHKHIKQGKKGITYRWLCMAGPPGVGKTMKARNIAREHGMDFAEITGASLSQFKNGTAITEIDKLFTWAKHESDKGVVIFIDEVDSLLMDRNKLDQGSEQYAIVNHILNHTGDRSDKFMLIMTTNHIEGLDQAIYDRVDDFVMMDLPDKAHRERVLMFYINKIFLNSENDASVIEHARTVFTPEFVSMLAEKTVGYSNRSLHGFINMLYGNSLIALDSKVTPELVDKTLVQMAQKMKLMQAVAGKSRPGAQVAAVA